MFKTLYSKSRLGAVLQWQIEVEGNKFRTHEGQVGGKITISEWTECFPKNSEKKNARTAEEQAIFEAKAKWDKKLKTGYSENIDNAGEKDYIQCMLAEKYDKYKDEITFPAICQNKFNGVRSITTKDYSKSRKGEVWKSTPHINKALIKFFKKHPNAVLDGELYSYEHREQLNELIQIVRKTVKITEEVLRRSEEIVKYYIYDGYLCEEDKDKPYKERINSIESALFSSNSDYVDYKHEDYPILVVNFDKEDCRYNLSWEVSSHEDILRLFNRMKDDKEEGVMIRWGNTGYINGRTKYLLKVKSIEDYVKEDDDECEVLEIHTGRGNWGKVAKTATVKWKDRIFDATLVGSMPEAEEVFKNKEKWIGKVVTFYFIGLTGLKNPNYPRIKINNCFNDKSPQGFIED